MARAPPRDGESQDRASPHGQGTPPQGRNPPGHPPGPQHPTGMGHPPRDGCPLMDGASSQGWGIPQGLGVPPGTGRPPGTGHRPRDGHPQGRGTPPRDRASSHGQGTLPRTGHRPQGCGIPQGRGIPPGTGHPPRERAPSHRQGAPATGNESQTKLKPIWTDMKDLPGRHWPPPRPQAPFCLWASPQCAAPRLAGSADTAWGPALSPGSSHPEGWVTRAICSPLPVGPSGTALASRAASSKTANTGALL